MKTTCAARAKKLSGLGVPVRREDGRAHPRPTWSFPDWVGSVEMLVNAALPPADREPTLRVLVADEVARERLFRLRAPERIRAFLLALR